MKSRLLVKPMAMAMLATALLFSCMNDEGPLDEEPTFSAPNTLILGKKLQNPFSVANMELAYRRLQGKGIVNNLNIRTTHLYIRFLPDNEAAVDRLYQDTTLMLSDHPLDYEIVQDGDLYHDPSLPPDKPTYLYTAIPINYKIPEGIAYEVLEELYLPEQDNELLEEGRVSDENEDLLNALEDEALSITGNEERVESDDEMSNGRKKSKWVPSGNITVWDNRLNQYIPLQGVKVRARNWFRVDNDYTDASGNFQMDKSFRKAVRYLVIFERNNFDIRSGTFGQAKFRGPKMKGAWNLKIEKGGMAFHYAHVFRAAFRYYYGDIGGLRRPSFRMKYSVFDKRGGHIGKNIGNWSVFGINPNILIYRYNPHDGSENDADEMFSVTCHETAHATHMQVMKVGAIQFLQVSESIRESWAIGVEWYITQKEYKEKGIANYAEASYQVRANYPTLFGFQFWNKKRNATLTSLFIDLVDKNNQLGQRFGSYEKGTVSDPVAGYTLAGIESNFLHKVYGLPSLSNELKLHKPSELTDLQIDILLKNF